MAMSLEIEHKYLVANDSFKTNAISVTNIRQGYLARDIDATVRVRVAGKRAFLTVKTRNAGCVRKEFEYEIPRDEGIELLKICKGEIIEKDRYLTPFGGFDWEIDVFRNQPEGIVLAEIELPAADTPYPLPPFVGKNVTGEPEYYNSNIHKLARR